MKKNRKIAVIISMMMVMVMFLAACGSKAPMTLEEFVANDEEASEDINEAAQEAGLDVEIKENTVIYTYDLKNLDGISEDLAKSETITKALAEALVGSAENFTDLCKELEEGSEIEGIKIEVIYTFDGEVLVSQSYDASGVIDADDSNDDSEEADD